MTMQNSKKGIMFTIISVLVCALIITSFFAYQKVSLDSDVENTKLRIKSIDRFANDADAYVGSLVYASGKETLDFTLKIMIGNNSFLSNYSEEFRSCMLSGHMDVPWNQLAPVPCPQRAFLAGEFDSFEDFTNSNLNLQSKITLNNIGIEQEDPWNIIVYANYTLVITDSYAFWNETRITKTRIGIEGLPDPTYAIVNSTGNPNVELLPIRDTSQRINVSKTLIWYEVPSIAHAVVMNGSYFAWAGAPSYLERLEGIKNPSSVTNFSGSNGATCTTGAGRCGIVSVISTERMQHYAQGHEGLFNSITRSNIDFEFWGNIHIAPEASHLYGRYDFWKTYLNFDEKRGRMGISVANANRGLNGTILPDTLMAKINMTDPQYIRNIN